MKIIEGEGLPEWRNVLHYPEIPLVGEDSNNTLTISPAWVEAGTVSGIATANLLYYDVSILWGRNGEGQELAVLGHYAPDNDEYHLALVDQAATQYGNQYGIKRWTCFFSDVDHPLARVGRHMSLPGKMSRALRGRGEVFQNKRPFPTTAETIERIIRGERIYQQSFSWKKESDSKIIRQIGLFDENNQFSGFQF